MNREHQHHNCKDLFVQAALDGYLDMWRALAPLKLGESHTLSFQFPEKCQVAGYVSGAMTAREHTRNRWN